MLKDLAAQPKDKILMLMEMYRDDPRDQKVDLGVGVYKDATGATPIMRAIKAAEQQLWQSEKTKSYTGLAGDPGFTSGMRKLVLGDAAPASHVAAAATPGGTGAIRQAFDLVRMSAPDATVWLSAPTWPNHPSILKHMGMAMAEYRYFDNDSRAVYFDGMLADLAGVKAGDVVLLCSDGVTDPLDDPEILALCGKTHPEDLPQVLVDESIRRGGEDNITAVVVLVEP